MNRTSVNREPIEHMDTGQSTETAQIKSNLDFHSICGNCARVAFVWQDTDAICEAIEGPSCQQILLTGFFVSIIDLCPYNWQESRHKWIEKSMHRSWIKMSVILSNVSSWQRNFQRKFESVSLF